MTHLARHPGSQLSNTEQRIIAVMMRSKTTPTIWPRTADLARSPTWPCDSAAGRETIEAVTNPVYESGCCKG